MEGSQSPDEQIDHDPERKINMFLNINKTVCVSVKKSDTVGHVKAILNEKEGMSESVQSLFFSGECLHDYQNLVDCGIKENSTVQVFVQDFVPLMLFIKPLSHPKILVIEATSNHTIENVKQSIAAKEEGTHLGSFSLIYAGKQLPEDMTLESLHIQGGSTLHMVTTQKEAVTVSVKLPRGEILKMEVKLLYAVRDVKTVVESISGYPVHNLALVCNGVFLEDSKNLSSYNISEESMIEMVQERIWIVVKAPDGNELRVKVHPEELVINLKEKLAATDRVFSPDHQCLIFEGHLLSNHKTLAGYNIKNESTLDLVFKTNSG